jgi:hypothetical protein
LFVCLLISFFGEAPKSNFIVCNILIGLLIRYLINDDRSLFVLN